MMGIGEIRKKIDSIDSELISLLNKRFELSLQTGRIKDKIEDSAREANVIANVKNLSNGLADFNFTENIFRSIISQSKRLQAKNWLLGGFQGEHGAFSEIALLKYSPQAVPIPCMEFSDVFSKVKSSELDFGIVPVENFIEGAINQVNGLLINSGLYVVAEITQQVHHCLLGLQQSSLDSIKFVYSHPQALGQCREFLESKKIEMRPYYDTAGSAMMISKEKLNSSAAIASSDCARLYNLKVLAENIELHGANATRFFIISRDKPQGGNKCTITFNIQHEPGSLFSIIQAFSDEGINLTRIGSIPIIGKSGEYSFIVDFQGSESDQNVISALSKARNQATSLAVIGCYKDAGK